MEKVSTLNLARNIKTSPPEAWWQKKYRTASSRILPSGLMCTNFPIWSAHLLIVWLTNSSAPDSCAFRAQTADPARGRRLRFWADRASYAMLIRSVITDWYVIKAVIRIQIFAEPAYNQQAGRRLVRVLVLVEEVRETSALRAVTQPVVRVLRVTAAQREDVPV